jgi:hypothetical protein
MSKPRTWPTFECTACCNTLANAFGPQLCKECDGAATPVPMDDSEVDDQVWCVMVLVQAGDPEDYEGEAYGDTPKLFRTREKAEAYAVDLLLEKVDENENLYYHGDEVRAAHPDWFDEGGDEDESSIVVANAFRKDLAVLKQIAKAVLPLVRFKLELLTIDE